MNYISLMGTQIMAVLNPLLALLEKGISIDEVHLPATRRTKELAEKARDYLISPSCSLNGKKIIIHSVANGLEADDNGPAVHHAMAAICSDCSGDMVFNLAGGMNFQMVACVQAMSEKRCLYVYPESSQIHTFLVDDFEILKKETLPLPGPIDVLALQGIEAEALHTPSNGLRSLKTMMQQCGVKSLPKGAKTHVRITSSSLNQPVVFDLVWNTGNELRFLKSIMYMRNKKPEHYLNEARSFINVALNRDLFSELFHRKMGVLTNHKFVDARLKEEGAGKVASFYITDPPTPFSIFSQKKFTDFIRPTKPARIADRHIPIQTQTESTGNAKPGNSLLITSLGNDILTTLIALWSHNPDGVCFVYTPGVEPIEMLKASILKNKASLPVHTVHFHPAGVDGAAIMDIDIQGVETAMVNITPGTKGHAAFLTLWARQHHCPVYSLKTDPPVYEQIPSGDGGKQQLPDLLAYFTLKWGNVLKPGTGKAKVIQDKDQHETILAFLRMMDQHDVPITKFYREPIHLPNAHSQFFPQKNGVKISRHGQPDRSFSVFQDEWFEALTGYVMTTCGATDLRIRFRSAWPDHIAQRLRDNPEIKNEGFLSDVDVIATIDNTYYVISCKTSKKKDPGALTLEVSAQSSLFGRFAIPLLCFLKYEGAPYNTNNGVYIFGYKTLCDKTNMTALLKRAKIDRSTIRRP